MGMPGKLRPALHAGEFSCGKSSRLVELLLLKFILHEADDFGPRSHTYAFIAQTKQRGCVYVFNFNGYDFVFTAKAIHAPLIQQVAMRKTKAGAATGGVRVAVQKGKHGVQTQRGWNEHTTQLAAAQNADPPF